MTQALTKTTSTLQDVIHSKGSQTIETITIMLTLQKRQQRIANPTNIALKHVPTAITRVAHMRREVTQTIQVRQTTLLAIKVINR